MDCKELTAAEIRRAKRETDAQWVNRRTPWLPNLPEDWDEQATIDRLLPYLSGDKEIPLPDGLKIWFGPYGNAEYRANRA